MKWSRRNLISIMLALALALAFLTLASTFAIRTITYWSRINGAKLARRRVSRAVVAG